MDKKPEKLVPEVRFKGFTDDWEQHKLGDFGNVQMNKRIFKSQTLDSGDVPFYKIGTFGKKADAYISSELYEEYRNKYPYPKDGDLLISASGSIGKIVEYKGQRAYYQDSNIVWLDHDNRILNLFLKAFFQIVKWSGTEGSTIKRLYNKNILNTEIILPRIKEQTAIGKLIEKFDYLITLQQRKLEQLKQLKKAMLQQLFVDKNSKQPNLRFKNFNGDWKQRKGKSIFYSKSNKDFPELTVLSATQDKGMVPRSSTGIGIKYEKKSLRGYKKVEPGDFIVHLRSFQGGFAYSDLTGIVSPAYTVFTFKQPEMFNNYFWKEKFTSYNFIQLLKKVTYGVRDGRSISYSDFLTLNEKFPVEVEQTKIADLFKKINNLIAFQQNKLTQLTTLKKYLLQKLFI
ncbi:restriction endonuclease subunit S [Limosilactobacillus reuteri]|uniref:restriction endonuclease subunit S n=1 Tax=Limosilactobacillus reuteri TaxID=1598 RepID=UPI00128D4DBC|nr:restriction endonuclease subunit S [Limosilactobacillus reuteri]MQB75950.1 restriction endonuclease subunit S [Limosilactobacillus reuteri]MQB98007.1 restriction endonuclease subunit S [Limosilactobacillus reuteri]